MIGEACVERSEQKILCGHDRTLGISYYLQSLGPFDLTLATLLSFDSHVRL